jgi:hypothetical protein
VPRFNAAADVIVSAPALVVSADAALPVSENAPVNWVKSPVTVVAIPECPTAIEVAVDTPRLSAPVESTPPLAIIDEENVLLLNVCVPSVVTGSPNGAVRLTSGEAYFVAINITP